jgi:hypothetical protein
MLKKCRLDDEVLHVNDDKLGDNGVVLAIATTREVEDLRG